MNYSDLSIWDIITLIGISVGLILSFILIIRSNDKIRSLPIFLFVTLLTFELFIRFLGETGMTTRFPHLIYTSEPFTILYGLLIYFHTRNQLYQKPTFFRFDLLLIAPFFLSFFSYLPFYLQSPAQKLMEFTEYGGLKYEITENIWEWNFEIVVNVAFLIAALMILEKYIEKIKHQFSNTQHIEFQLTRRLIYICIGIYFLELIFVYATLYNFPYYNTFFDGLQMMKILGLFLISYDAIRSLNHIQKIQTHWVDLPEPNKIKNENGIKYAKSALDKETSLNIKERIITYMEQHKPYLEPQLRIKDLSELTEIPPHHLSQVINELLQQNFYEFVNSYRIKEAIRLLKDPKYKTYTYEAIGFEVGFNSKSAFYKAFKKETNTTPAKFK